MSKSVYYFYDGCTINVYNVEVNEEKLIIIRKKIMENCCQYNHAIYETKGYPNLMDESKKYLKITDTGKYEINPKYYEWNLDDEVDLKIRIYLVDVIEYIEPIIIKVIDDILAGNYENTFDIYRLSCSKSEYINFKNNELTNLNQQCNLINMVNKQNEKELMVRLNQLKKELKLIRENINKNKNMIFASVFAKQVMDTITTELIESVSIDEFNKSSIYKLKRKLGTKK